MIEKRPKKALFQRNFGLFLSFRLLYDVRRKSSIGLVSVISIILCLSDDDGKGAAGVRDKAEKKSGKRAVNPVTILSFFCATLCFHLAEDEKGTQAAKVYSSHPSLITDLKGFTNGEEEERKSLLIERRNFPFGKTKNKKRKRLGEMLTLGEM